MPTPRMRGSSQVEPPSGRCADVGVGHEEAGVLGGDADVGRQGQAEASAGSRAVDAGHHGLGEATQGQHDLVVQGAGQFPDGLGNAVGALLFQGCHEVAHVCPGAEGAARAGEQDGAYVG